MSEQTKERKMTAKGFLHKTTTKAAKAATAFLAQHRAWLETGELAQFTSPILAKLDEKEILPTPALEAIKAVVLGHMLAKDCEVAEAKIQDDASKGRSQKPWLATIYNCKGEVCTRLNEKGEEEDLQKGFDLSSDADRWVDRRLFDGQSDWFGVINSPIHKSETTVIREDAIARILKKPKPCATRKTSASTSTLGFRPKVQNDRFYFSRG